MGNEILRMQDVAKDRRAKPRNGPGFTVTGWSLDSTLEYYELRHRATLQIEFHTPEAVVAFVEKMHELHGL